MNESKIEETNDREEKLDQRIKEFTAIEAEKVSSHTLVRVTDEPIAALEKTEITEPTTQDVPERSEVFKKLADPKLPSPEKRNRARLQMQSPTKLYFYWSMTENPFQKLNRALHRQSNNYTLVIKLIDISRETEEIWPCDASGSWWFDVESGREYRAEIGFYSPSRPFVRVMFSNAISTPKQSPSRVPSIESQWSVSADKFAQVLDVSGFKRDAFDVALAGDDAAYSDHQAVSALRRFTSKPIDAKDFHPEDIRYALFALASGFKLDELRHRIGSRLFSMLKGNEMTSNKAAARDVVEKHFSAEAADIVEEISEPLVFGASRIHFQKRFRSVPRSGRFEPLSSLNAGVK